MSLTDEAANDQSQLNAALKQAIGTISNDQEVTFTQYNRVVLPIDGFVFWVRANLVNQGAIPNTFAPNRVRPGQAPAVETPATQLTVKGALHFASTRTFEEVENYSINDVIFSCTQPIEPLNNVGPATLWIGQYRNLRFAFGSHGLFMQSAGEWHYRGNAIYPDMESQIIDNVAAFSRRQVVSNSLPIWLSMRGYEPKPWQPFGCTVPLYPSYQLPANILPPWGVIHIPPESTRAIASAPRFGRKWSHWQFCQETVQVTLFGLRNDAALDFVDFVQQYQEITEDFGIMNIPTIRDEKRTQAEIGTIAQKKTVTFDINYLQHRANDIARKLILEAIPTFYFNSP